MLLLPARVHHDRLRGLPQRGQVLHHERPPRPGERAAREYYYCCYIIITLLQCIIRSISVLHHERPPRPGERYYIVTLLKYYKINIIL